MVARFSECAMVSNWLPHTPVQIFFRLVLVHKTIWCSLSSSSIQTGVLAVTFCITLVCMQSRSEGVVLLWLYDRPWHFFLIYGIPKEPCAPETIT